MARVPRAPHRRFGMLWLHLKVLGGFAVVSIMAMCAKAFLDHEFGIFAYTGSILVVGNVIGMALFEVYCRFIQKEHTIYRIYGQLASTREFNEWASDKMRDYYWKPDDRDRTSRLDQEWAQAVAHGDQALDAHGTRADLTKRGTIRLHTRALRARDTTQEILKSFMAIEVGLPNGPRMMHALVSVSGMAYGTITDEATRAISIGAAGQFVVVTGEGGYVASAHAAGGADCRIIFQFGTGYFGCRTLDGKFDLAQLVALVKLNPQIRGVQIKLGQGVKNGKGGNLPARKVPPVIARIRGVRPWEDCISPPVHSAFSGAAGLVPFIHEVRTATGLPVSVKLAVGSLSEIDELAQEIAMHPEGAPDLIQIDGAEGGTGASYMELMGRTAFPVYDAIQIVDLLFRYHKVRGRVKIMASGQNFTPEDVIRSLGLGADLCATARGAKYALGCVAAGKCDRPGECPSGVTSNGKYLDVPLRAQYLRNYLDALHKRTAMILGVLDISDYREFVGSRTKYMDVVGVKIWTMEDVNLEIARENRRLPVVV